jgi:hypothetical protein
VRKGLGLWKQGTSHVPHSRDALTRAKPRRRPRS